MEGNNFRKMNSFIIIWLTAVTSNASNACNVSINVPVTTIHCDMFFQNEITATLPPRTIGIKLYLKSANELIQFNFTGIGNIYRLEIYAHQLSSIHHDTFIRFTGLRRLTIANTLLRELPGNIFTSLKTLKSLYIQNNRQLSKINNLAFTGLEIIENLYLTGNDFEILDPKPFDNLPELEVLNLRANKLSSIDPNLFSKFPNLRTLIIYGNRIKSLHRKTFSKLSKLKILDLKNNQLDNINDHLFKELSGLDTLHLENNEINFLSKDSFAGLKSLTRFYLSNNKLKEIQKETFSGLRKLTLLDLSHNELTYFQIISTSLNSSSLYYLNLNGNFLKMLNKDAMQGLGKLQVFYADDNPIESIDRYTFKSTPHLKIVSLNNCKIRNLPGTLFREQSSSLLRFYSSNNRIKFLNSSFMLNLQNLQNLDLSHNIGLSLSGIPLHSLSKLINLKLANISLMTFPENLSFHLKYVLELQVQDNLMTDLSSINFCEMTSLMRFNASGNKFRTIHPTQFSCFRKNCEGYKLCYIYIRNNPIQCTLYFTNVYRPLSQDIQVDADCSFNGSRIDASILNQDFFTPNWTALSPDQKKGHLPPDLRYTRQFHLDFVFKCLVSCKEIIYVKRYDLKANKRVNILSIEINTILKFCYELSNSSTLACTETNFVKGSKTNIEITQRFYRENIFYLMIFLNGEELTSIKKGNSNLYWNLSLTAGNNHSDDILIERLILYAEHVSINEAKQITWNNILLVIFVSIVLITMGFYTARVLCKTN